MSLVDANGIYRGPRDTQFRDFLLSLFQRSNLTKDITDILLSGENYQLFSRAFTGPTAHPFNNYERYEQIGDVSVKKFVVEYMYRRFPQIDCTKGVGIVARLKIYYESSIVLADLADRLGFWPFITALDAPGPNSQGNKSKKGHNRKFGKTKLLEDVFESFIGCTTTIIDNIYRPGVGYGIVYSILENIFDEENITLDYNILFDAKSVLNENIPYLRQNDTEFGNILYESTQDPITKEFYTYIIFQTRDHLKQKQKQTDQLPPGIIIGQGIHKTKVEAEKLAARKALDYLKKAGKAKPRDEFYNIFCE